MSVVLGMVTGIGGGTVRDALLAEMLTALRTQTLCRSGARRGGASLSRERPRPNAGSRFNPQHQYQA